MSIERDILATLSFFGILKQPLTLVEMVRYKHGKKEELYLIKKALESLVRKGIIFEREGVYARKMEYIERRIRHDQARNAAWKRITSFLPTLRANPFVKAVAIANSCAFDSMSTKSDADFFIVTQKNRTWTARLCAALPAKIKKIRPGETDVAPLCLSFFVDECGLGMESYVIEDDIYFAHWADSLVWVHDPEHIRFEFIKENEWASSLLRRPLNITYLPSVKTASGLIRKTLGMAPSDDIEKYLFEKQMVRMPQILRDAKNRGGTGVVLEKTVIKTHLEDKRVRISQQYEDEISKIQTGDLAYG